MTVQRSASQGNATALGVSGPVAAGPGRAHAWRWPLSPGRAADRMYWVAVAIVLPWALFLNFFRLGTPDVMDDEVTYATDGWGYLHGNLTTRSITHGKHPPLVKWLYGFAQLIAGHESVTAARVVAAGATILTGAVLLVWIGRIAGRWTGLLACSLALLLPEAVQGTSLRFGRFAFLDPVAELFVVLYLLLIWEWLASTRRRAWLFAAASGMAIGCATAAKENGFLAAVVPVLLVTLAARRDPHLMVQRLGQVALAVLASLGLFLLAYVPLGSPFRRIVHLVKSQAKHSSDGHVIGLAHHVFQHPPWWANLWFAAHGMGAAVTIFVVGFAALACALRRDRLVVFCLAALVGPLIFHCFIAGVALSFYWALWMPPLLALTALGGAEFAHRLQKAPFPRPVQVGAALLVLFIPLPACLALTRTTATITPSGLQVLGSVLARHRLTGPVLTSGISRHQFVYYLPNTPILMSPPTWLATIDAVVIGAPQCRLLTDNRTTRSIVAVNLATGRLREIHADKVMTVYAVTSKLAMPSPAQIGAQPPTNLAAGC
jgi:hypothetical protein